MKDLNTCYYSPGNDKHSYCTHQHYCIFNEKRTELEKTITRLENKIKTLKTRITLIEADETKYSLKGYKNTEKKLNNAIGELDNLKKFKKNIKRGDGYGYNN